MKTEARYHIVKPNAEEHPALALRIEIQDSVCLKVEAHGDSWWVLRSCPRMKYLERTWEPVAYFATEQDAEDFVRSQMPEHEKTKTRKASFVRQPQKVDEGRGIAVF